MKNIFQFILSIGLCLFCSAQTSANKFQVQTWLTQGGYQYPNSEQWVAGDFNGDGRCDVARILNDGGLASIDVFLSTGNNTFVKQRWATRQGGFWNAQKWFAGDFNGDGQCDLANVFNEGGYASIDVHASSGNSFGIQRWATRQGGFWDAQQWMAGDFNGDSRCDLANVFSDGGRASIDVHSSTGNSFGIQRWATRQGDFWNNQRWSAGDFNGDGFCDIVNSFDDNNLTSIDVHLSTGSLFGIQRWVTQCDRKGQLLVGNFNFDTHSDVAYLKFINGKYNDQTGSYDLIDTKAICLSDILTLNRFLLQPLDQFTLFAPGNLQSGPVPSFIRAGDFNGDGFCDIAYFYGDGRIDVHVNSGQY
ncbi:MAG: VCBS repeat-containing protein [Holophagaceae bacterium]|nr:VCBS repeat-containing protein [Holophagaceae bacterium]